MEQWGNYMVDYQTTIDQARAQLGEEVYAAAFAGGKSLTRARACGRCGEVCGIVVAERNVMRTCKIARVRMCMSEMVRLEIAINPETLRWLEEQAQRFATNHDLDKPERLGPADVVSMIVERARAGVNPTDEASYVDPQGNRWFSYEDYQQSVQKETLQRPAADEGGLTAPASTNPERQSDANRSDLTVP
jgi:hypothetical protein